MTRDIAERLQIVIANGRDQGMRTDVLEDAKREIERLREVLRFYANGNNYDRKYLGFKPGFGEHFQPSAISDDLFGSKARAALAPGQKLGPAPALSLPSQQSNTPGEYDV